MKSNYFLLILSTILYLASCGKNAESVTIETEKDFIKTNQAFISPNGVRIANSIATFKTTLSPAVFDLLGSNSDFEIIHYEFLETDTQTAVFVDVDNKIGESGRLIFVKEFSLQRAEDKCYTISCSGDCHCNPQGTIQNGSVNFNCNGDCSCSMTVRESDCK